MEVDVPLLSQASKACSSGLHTITHAGIMYTANSEPQYALMAMFDAIIDEPLPVQIPSSGNDFWAEISCRPMPDRGVTPQADMNALLGAS